MAENYYHSLKNMTPVAIVEDNHHEIESFHNVMANYLMQNDRIYERFPDAFPALYFDAIDLSAEAFAGAIARSESVAQDVGSTRSKYNQTLQAFTIYSTHTLSTALKAVTTSLLITASIV